MPAKESAVAMGRSRSGNALPSASTSQPTPQLDEQHNLDDEVSHTEESQEPSSHQNNPRQPSFSQTPAAALDPAFFQEQMMQMMQAMTEAISASSRAAARADTPGPTYSSKPEPKVKDPETFHGNRNSLSAFITECELVFELQPSRFTDERTKASYMISLLRDTPLLAIRPLMSAEPRPAMFNDHKLLVEYLRTSYGDPDEKGTARRKLKGVRQNGSASAYFAELQQYIAVLGWKEQEQIVDRAIDGLKPHLKDEIARSNVLPKTLSDLISFVIPLDNRMYEREIERKHESKDSNKVTTTRTTVTSAPAAVATTTRAFTNAPAPITNTNQRFAQATGQQGQSAPRGPLSDAEKQRRRDNNLCLRCGDPGHVLVDCPGYRPRPVTQTITQVKQEPVSYPQQGKDQGQTH